MLMPWDLICYAHAGLEILAYSICIEQFGADNVDWPKFWEYIENEQLFFESKKEGA
jgi:hypothetical protein